MCSLLIAVMQLVLEGSVTTVVGNAPSDIMNDGVRKLAIVISPCTTK